MPAARRRVWKASLSGAQRMWATHSCLIALAGSAAELPATGTTLRSGSRCGSGSRRHNLVQLSKT